MEKTKAPFPKWVLGIIIAAGGIVTLTTLAIILMFIPGGYGSRQSLDDVGGSSGFMPDLGTPSYDGEVGKDVDTSYPPEQPEVAPTDSEERKLIKSAQANVVVESLKNAESETKRLVETYDGYVIGITQYDSPDSDVETFDITVRVPVEHFDKFMEDLEKFGRVEYKIQKSDDVTDEYVDLESKLRNLEASETQYLEIMKKATKVEEILAVQQQLSNVRSEIEVIKGRMLYIDKSAELSTIQISYTLEERAKDVINDEWDPMGTIRNALKSLVSTVQVLADAVIYLVVLSPIVLVPGLIIYVVKRSREAKNSSKK